MLPVKHDVELIRYEKNQHQLQNERDHCSESCLICLPSLVSEGHVGAKHVLSSQTLLNSLGTFPTVSGRRECIHQVRLIFLPCKELVTFVHCCL